MKEMTRIKEMEQRIAALEAELAACREDNILLRQSEADTTMDALAEAYRWHVVEKLEAENAALKIERDKYVGATQCATRSAERRWQKLQAIMQILGTQGDPEVEAAAVMTDLERVKNERDALREDKARLEQLEEDQAYERSTGD